MGDNTIFGKMTSRAAGKRQIKPTAVLFEAVMQDQHDSDEEDEDFEMEGADRSMESEGSGSGSESGSEENSDEEESGEDEEEQEEAPEELPKMKICAVCVNHRKIEDVDEFMTCDNCQITVHESCYLGVFLEDNIDDQTTTTTHWFCEPCMYGLNDTPFCEFCPSRIGAFKRSDVGGRWVHLTCALFTPGISFSAVDVLSGVSWQEIGNSQFGRKPCAGCRGSGKNRPLLESRLGIVTRCESGLCKEHFHATCAQKLGLLVDETDAVDAEEEKEAASVLRYFFCRKHANQEKAKREQKIYSIFEQQEQRRITQFRRRKSPTSEEIRNRKMMQKKLETHFDLPDNTINIPTEAIEKPRRARLLITSPEFFDRFETKSMDSGKSQEQFREPFFDVKLTNSWPIPIGFSKEYMDYISYRDFTQIPEEEEKVAKLRIAVKLAKEKQQKLEKSPEIAAKIAENSRVLREKTSEIDAFLEVLCEFAEKSREFDGFFEEFGEFGKSKKKVAKNEENLKNCAICSEASNQHKITSCDECHKFYHIFCLNPPLSRLPKRSAKFGWICEDCNETSTENSEIAEVNEEEKEKREDTPENQINLRSSRNRRPPNRHSAFLEH